VLTSLTVSLEQTLVRELSSAPFALHIYQESLFTQGAICFLFIDPFDFDVAIYINTYKVLARKFC
jgi:hypothetical protein